MRRGMNDVSFAGSAEGEEELEQCQSTEVVPHCASDGECTEEEETCRFGSKAWERCKGMLTPRPGMAQNLPSGVLIDLF